MITQDSGEDVRMISVPRGMPRSIVPLMVLALLGLGTSGRTSADVVEYHVSVNTSSVAATAGSLDFQLNPGDVTSEALHAVVSGFTATAGTSLVSPSSTTGAASGTLPGPLTFDNTAGLNEVVQGLTYGNGFSFNVTFSGAAVDHASTGLFGSTFSLSLLDSSSSPILSGDPSGAVLTVDFLTDGSIATTTYPSDTSGGAPVAQVSSLVPEPASTALFLTGGAILGLGLTVRRHGRRRGCEVSKN